MNNWINCSEELPEFDLPVWINCADGRVIIAERSSSTDGWLWAMCLGQYFDDGVWQCVESVVDDDYEPTHWQPLPEPPTE